MNVYQLRDNLKNTIKNKRELLNAMLADDCSGGFVPEFLDINIKELERILADVEICCKYPTSESWRPIQERMVQ